MNHSDKTEYSDCIFCGKERKNCAILKKLYCKTNPDKKCAWYKSKKERYCPYCGAIIRRWCNMWVIFLLSAMVIALCAFLIAYIGNKILIKMKKDLEKSEIRKDEEKWKKLLLV